MEADAKATGIAVGQWCLYDPWRFASSHSCSLHCTASGRLRSKLKPPRSLTFSQLLTPRHSVHAGKHEVCGTISLRIRAPLSRPVAVSTAMAKKLEAPHPKTMLYAFNRFANVNK